eukprot:scaffold130856_cov17-Tisochrysis_lutea.AAC.1
MQPKTSRMRKRNVHQKGVRKERLRMPGPAACSTGEGAQEGQQCTDQAPVMYCVKTASKVETNPGFLLFLAWGQYM